MFILKKINFEKIKRITKAVAVIYCLYLSSNIFATPACTVTIDSNCKTKNANEIYQNCCGNGILDGDEQCDLGGSIYRFPSRDAAGNIIKDPITKQNVCQEITYNYNTGNSSNLSGCNSDCTIATTPANSGSTDWSCTTSTLSEYDAKRERLSNLYKKLAAANAGKAVTIGSTGFVTVLRDDATITPDDTRVYRGVNPALECAYYTGFGSSNTIYNLNQLNADSNINPAFKNGTIPPNCRQYATDLFEFMRLNYSNNMRVTVDDCSAVKTATGGGYNWFIGEMQNPFKITSEADYMNPGNPVLKTRFLHGSSHTYLVNLENPNSCGGGYIF